MIFVNDLPYLTISRQIVNLPKGNPSGRGNLIFLLTHNREESYALINSKKNYKHGTYYKYYFYNVRYYGKIVGRSYRLNDYATRKTIKEDIQKSTGLMLYPGLNLGSNGNNVNVYFDLSKYLDIFNTMAPDTTPTRYVKLFWDYFKTVYFSESYNKYDYKMVLIDIGNFKGIKGDLRTIIKNPVFLLYYALYRNFELVKDVDIDFVLFHNNFSLKINPSKLDDKSFRLVMRLLKQLYTYAGVNIGTELDEEVITKQERELVVADQIAEKLNATGKDAIEVKTMVTNLDDAKSEKKEAEAKKETIKASIENKVKEANEKLSPSEPVSNSENITVAKAVKVDAENSIIEDKELLATIFASNQSKTVPKSAASSKRDEELRKNLENVKVNNVSIKDITKVDPSHIETSTRYVGNVVKTTNENVKNVKFVNRNKEYIEKGLKYDIVNAFKSLSGKSLPIYIRNIEVTDTSSPIDLKETWRVEVEDTNRVRSTITVDIPKFVDNKFMYIGGNKKLILNQNMMLPIVKLSPSTVQIVTNYNKMTVQRNETKTFADITKINKAVADVPSFAKYFTIGNAFEVNAGYITTIEYDELSKFYTKYGYYDFIIFFNQEVANEYADHEDIKIPDGKMFIGIEGSNPIFIDTDTQLTDDGKTIPSLIIEHSPEAAKKYIASIKSGKRQMYAEVVTMKKPVPVIVLISFWEGFERVLRLMNIEYRLENRVPKDLPNTESFIKFKDAVFIYKNNAVASLMLNGLRTVKTEQINIADMNTRNPYVEIFRKIYGKLSIVNTMDNTYEFMVDPITKEVCENQNLPDNITDMLIYSVKLLADNQFVTEISETHYRVRSLEIIPAILYDSLGKNYITYKNSNGKKKFSIPRDDVIKKCLALKTVEDLSELNPTYEMERTRAISNRGWRGNNLEDYYSIPRRVYHDTMRGIMGTTTSPDASVGIARTLTMEPNIMSLRGYVDIADKKTIKDLKDVNLFSPAEMSMPLSVTRDDNSRVGHAIKQSGHTVPVKNSAPVLISNGFEQVARFELSSTYAVNADKDGVVKEIANDIMVVEYKDGTHRAVNLGPNIVKNSGGGFYETNEIVTDLKVGDKFKQNDCLAYHKNFFKNTLLQGTAMTMGCLEKVAIMSTYNTFQDATLITEKFSRDASTEMTFCKQVVVGKNSHVSSIVKVGDNIEIGDTLIRFDASADDAEINNFLAALSKDPKLESEILDASANNIKAKTAGKIVAIKVYSTVDVSEMSPSLAKIVKGFYADINKRKKMLESYDKTPGVMKCGMLFTESVEKVAPNKFGVIRGQKMEEGSVLFEFYTEHEELLEVGSKIANFTGLKNTINEIIPAGYEPYGEYRPDEEISTIIAANSILKRMVPSVILTVAGYKVLIELSRQCIELWTKSGSADIKKTRNDICQKVYKCFSAFDKSGTNTKRYKDLFEGMSDAQFKKFMDAFSSTPDSYFTLDIVDYEHTIFMDDIQRAADTIKVPLFEYVYMPWLTMDKNNTVRSPQPVLTGYICEKRTQQSILKKNGLSTTSDKRSAITGQVTAESKNGRESDLENSMLIALGMDAVIRELDGPRADDPVMKNQMLNDINTNGYTKLSDMISDPKNKTTLNTVNVYLLGMGLSSDLVTKGYILPKALDEELR